jgi:hypothetical protein
MRAADLLTTRRARGLTVTADGDDSRRCDPGRGLRRDRPTRGLRPGVAGVAGATWRDNPMRDILLLPAALVLSRDKQGVGNRSKEDRGGTSTEVISRISRQRP